MTWRGSHATRVDGLITNRIVARRILVHLRLDCEPAPIANARLQSLLSVRPSDPVQDLDADCEIVLALPTNEAHWREFSRSDR